MATAIKLKVNDISISVVDFVADFTESTVKGMMHGLKGVDDIRDLILTIKQGVVSIQINKKEIPVNEFATKIIISSMNGLLKPLKGVTLPIRKVELVIGVVKLKAN